MSPVLIAGLQGILGTRFLVLYVRRWRWLAKTRGIKDDNLLGIPPHFLIETRRVMDSGVERSTGPVC